MPEKTMTSDEDLPTILLGRLPKLELKQGREGSGRSEFQFERNVLSAAGMTHEREVELVGDLVGEEKWAETQTPPEGAPETEAE
jgi:hypothetical protein